MIFETNMFHSVKWIAMGNNVIQSHFTGEGMRITKCGHNVNKPWLKSTILDEYLIYTKIYLKPGG